MTPQIPKLTNPQFASFYKKNPDFDILHFNFLDEAKVSKLKLAKKNKAKTLKDLMAYQRVLRLYPNDSVATKLIKDGLDSSIKITNISKSVFIKNYGPKFGLGGTEIADQIYNTARQSKSKVMHLVASAKNLAGSSHSQAMLFNQIPSDVSKSFQHLASYQDFFGSLDYCDCTECRSIFGAAAYLVDLLRIIDQGITQPNTEIQNGLHFFDRRPDIATIELNCENTNGLIPYLQIVNNLLESTLENALKQSGSLIGEDVYLTLANTYFPFNLPFHLPLQQIETVLDNKNVALADITSVLSKDTTMSGDEARQILNLSIETLNNLKSQAPATLAAVVSKNYGLTVTSNNLAGLDQVATYMEQSSLSLKDITQVLTQNLNAKEIFDVSGTYTLSDFGPNLIMEQKGSSITGTYGTDGTLKGDIDGLLMKGQWYSDTQAPPSKKGDFEFTFTADGASFTGKWSKGLGLPWETTAWDGTLTGSSTEGIIPHSLFINGTLPAKEYLKIKDVNEIDTIVGQTLGTLDRLNRFIRLSALTGWSYSDLNWILMTLGTTEINDATFVELAKIKQAVDKYGLDLNLLSCLWFDLKTIGMGQGPVSAAPFDQVFNTQTIVQQTGQTYHPTIAASPTSFVNPLYTDQSDLLVVDQSLYDASNPNQATKKLVSQGQTIIKGIPASQDDILAIALAAFGKVATIELTVSNLSTLYRHVMFAKQLNSTVDRYVLLLKLLGYGTSTSGDFTISAILDRDAVLSILETTKKIQSSGFTVYDIDYLINQTYDAPISSYVNNGYKLSALPDFLNTLREVLKGSVCVENSFAYNTITNQDSEQLFNSFTSLGFIDSSGLIIKDPAKITTANWSSIYIGKLLQKDDFVYNTKVNADKVVISAADSTKIFDGLLAQNIIDATGWMIKNLSKVNWDSIKIGSPEAKLSPAQKDYVISKIESLQSNADSTEQAFIISKLTTIQTHQSDLFANQIGAFFGVKEDIAALAIEAVSAANEKYLESFIVAASSASTETSEIFVLNISKKLLLQRVLALTSTQFSSISLHPNVYGLSGQNTYSLASILLMANLKPVIQAFGDVDDKLLQYFDHVWATPPLATEKLQAEICEITNWNEQQYIAIAQLILTDPIGCKTLSDVLAVKSVFDIAAKMGIDTYFLQELKQTATLAATKENWPAYNNSATKLLLTMQVTTSSDAIEDQYKKINSTIEGKKRDAMLFFSIWVLGKTWSDIKTPRSLYEFLLIDPENGGCAEISLIEEAMNAAQLYLKRCRLNLEENVHVSTDDIPDVWWEWMMSYRVWGANRKIFVYPENYIEPSLRKSKTSLFKDLENTLMQGEVTGGLVESAYIKYLDGFSLFAKLRYVDAYQTIVHDKERGPIDTLFLFARTQEQPYHFYYLTKEKVGSCEGDDQYLWSEWKNINIKIDAEHITPIYAFNKLFVFWIELTSTKESGGLTGETGGTTNISSHSNIITKATVKYSYYNFNEKWIQPQTLVSDKVVNVLTLEKDIYGSFKNQFTNTETSFWNRVSVINTKATNYVGDEKSIDEKLIVYFGPLANYDNLGIAPASPNKETDTTSVYAFKEMLEQSYFNLEQMKTLNREGYIPLCSHYIIDETSNHQIILNQDEYLVLASNTLSKSISPTFAIEINDKQLAITTNYSTIATNNSDGIEKNISTIVSGAQTLEDESFVVSPYIDLNQSIAIQASITANMPGVIVDNKITAAALDQAVPNIAAELSISENQAQLVQTKFYELFYGSKVLFSNIAHNAEVVPVKNQANTFILDNNDESFLITAVNNVIEISPAVLTKDSFISSGKIDAATSEAYFGILSKAPNDYIQSDGTVNSTLLAGTSAYVLSLLLATTVDIATIVFDTLTAANEGGTPKVFKRDFGKIDSQIRITAALSPACFISSTISESVSASYFKILSTSPNNYINENGSVNLNMAINANEVEIALLLGLQTSDSKAKEILYIIKSAANLITKDSFVSTAINPKTSDPYVTQQMSEGYFTVLSKAPNNYILETGEVNMVLLNNSSRFTIASLLGFSNDPGNFVVSKVISVLKAFNPFTLGYVYPNDSSDAAPSSLKYELDNIYSLQFITERLSNGAINQISHAISFGGIESALDLDVQQPPVTINKPFSYLDPNKNQLKTPLIGPVLIAPSLISNQEVAFIGPYGMYFWELFFHAPFLVGSLLNSNQQFTDAEKWLQYIFNPTTQKKFLTKSVFVTQGPTDIGRASLENLYPVLTKSPNKYIDEKGVVTSLVTNASAYSLSVLLAVTIDQGQEILNLLNNYYVNTPEVRAWQFDPFRNYVIQTLLQNLTSCAQIAEYNDDPFDPDAIARLRIGAYEKTIVMKYIDNLLDWGDFEFTQYSWESITMARMYYSYAYDLLGPKPVDLGPCESSMSVTFEDIEAKYKGGDIPQFLIDMEHLSSDGVTTSVAGNPGKAYNDLGYYFCIPENDQLTAYWDRVEDRLYKIRHCLNIEGVAQPLPLFQPPINPMDLVRASAQGGNVLGVANQQQQNISYYRFTYLIDRAKEFTGLVSEFGNTLLNVLEKSDSEALANLHLNQAKVILNMTLNIKNKQLEELESQLAGTQESLQSAQNKNLFYTTLINAGYNSSENSALEFIQASIDLQAVSAGIQGVSIVGYLLPNIFGFSDGGMKFGDAINMGSQMLQTTSQILGQKGGSLETVAQYQRRADDWKLQQESSQYEINQIQDQILSIQARIASSQQEIDIQKKNIDQNEEQLNFYKSKFTDQELYQWMISRISAIYFQAYKLALDTALTAQMSYQYELDRDDSIISFGYWDSLHKGLLAADGLKLSLAQLENSYITNHKRRMEIEKTISLKTLNPEAFYAFIAGGNKGNLNFSLTEELFDRDFPSHYCRRIKSISVTIPALVGPYQNIHATLTQNTNMVVLKADKDVVNYAIYATAPQHSGTAPPSPSADALRQNWASSQQIALSKGVDDSGLFVLNFEDQRYLPFEETGAISTWTLSMPPNTNHIDFSSISDIILSLKYTAKEGGSSFGGDVTGLYSRSDKQYQNIRINSFDINQAFASTWYNLFQTSPDASKNQTLTFPISDNVILPNLTNVKLDQIIIELETASGSTISSKASGLSLTVGTVTVPIAIENNKGAILESDINKLTTWHGLDWSLVFTTNLLPELCTDNKLDSSKLLNVIVFINYTSDI